MTAPGHAKLTAGTSVITNDGRRGTVLWPPRQVRDGRWRILVRFSGYEQFHDCDKVRVDFQGCLFDMGE